MRTVSKVDIEWWVAHPVEPEVLEACRRRSETDATPCRSPGTHSPASATC
jgi:hypothetical protein